MRLKLNDNERGAFHYLALGVAVTVAIRILAWVFSFIGPALTGDQRLLAGFQQGYPFLRGEMAVVGTTAGLTERMMQAVVLAVGVALVSAFVQAIPAWRERRPPTPTGTLITRVLLVSVLAWGVFTALFLPLRLTEVLPGQLVLTIRPAAFGDIPWPVPGDKVTLSSSQVRQVEAMRQAATGTCNGEERLLAVTSKDTLELSVRAGICTEKELQELRDASAIAAMLERELHTGIAVP